MHVIIPLYAIAHLALRLQRLYKTLSVRYQSLYQCSTIDSRERSGASSPDWTGWMVYLTQNGRPVMDYHIA